MKTFQVKNNNVSFECKIDITTEEWLKLLNDPKVTYSRTLKALLGFYKSPNHTATCSEVNPKKPSSPNALIWRWAQRVQNRLGRFQVLGTDGNTSYWIIPMTGRYRGRVFEWTVRPELVQAIGLYLKQLEEE